MEIQTVHDFLRNISTVSDGIEVIGSSLQILGADTEKVIKPTAFYLWCILLVVYSTCAFYM